VRQRGSLADREQDEADPVHERDGHDQRVRDVAERDRGDQAREGRAASGVREHHHALPVQAVDESAGLQRQDEQR
jgi:hypothetical protein